MDMGGVIAIALSSSVFVALINQLGNWLSEKRTQKYKKEEKTNTIEEQVKSTNKKIDEVLDVVNPIATQLNSVIDCTIIQSNDHIRYLALHHIERGWVTPDELRIITEMHRTYKALGGNGFLDDIMNRVKALPIKD